MGKLLTQQDVAKRLQVTVETIRKWRRHQKLPFVRLGHKAIRITEEDLERFVQNHKVGGSSGGT